MAELWVTKGLSHPDVQFISMEALRIGGCGGRFLSTQANLKDRT